MPVQDGVGFSQFTPDKLNDLQSILEMHIAITDAVLKRHPYYEQTYRYIDTTAGPGRYDVGEVTVEGSPLVFLSVAERNGIRYRADFIEQEPSNAQALREVLPKHGAGSIHIHCCDYTTMLDQLLADENRNQLGLLYVDPSTGVPDFDAIARVAKRRPRMQILMYLSATNLKRQYNVTDQLLSDYIVSINKKSWLVRRPIKSDRHQWTFLLGSNANIFRDYRQIHFYQLNSKEAQAFFPTLNLSSRLRQPRLFD